ncbi:MAG: SDR family oxidoreductase [Candidatus Nanopelagicales bacterium]
MTTLRGSTVLITGAASGIGRLMALEAVRRGARVIAWDRDAAALSELPGVETAVVDVTDREAVYAQAGRTPDIDVLVLNAGVVSGRRLSDLPDAAIEKTMAVNALALFWCTKAFLPRMVERDHGHIVTIASLVGATPVPGMTDYVASKHAAYGFAESLRTELADDAPGVRTTVVLPQVINTGMFAGTKSPWFFPELQPDYVATSVLNAVERNRQRLLLNRPALLTAYLVRPLPPAISDRISRWAGAFDGMATFHGRSVIEDRAEQG